ncbi:MAG: ABC transporter permease [Vicinamibacterales bacterium]
MVDDLRRALRVLRRSRTFALTAILTLALAVAANVTVFDLLDALLWRDIPVPHPEQLTVLTTANPDSSYDYGLTFPLFEQLQKTQHVFSSVIGWSHVGVYNIQTTQEDTHGACVVVSGRFYAQLGVTPLRGRLIADSDVNEDSIDPARVAVISEAFWREAYQAQDSAIGQTIRIEGQPFTIIGVTPPHFKGLGLAVEPDVTLPLTAWPRIEDSPLSVLRKGTGFFILTAGRLKAGVSLPQAAAAVQTLWPPLKASAVPAGDTPAQRDRFMGLRLHVRAGAHGVDDLQREFGSPLEILFALTTLMLFTACINLGALTSFRAAARTHDLRVRRALGAGWWGAVRPLVAENLLLSACGGLLGFWIGASSSSILAGVLLRDYIVPASLDLVPGLHLLMYAVVTMACSTAICSVAPAWLSMRMQSISPNGAGGSRTVSSRSQFGTMLVVVQICLSIVALTSAGVLIRTLRAIRAVPSGLDSAHAIVAYPMPKPGGYDHVNNDQYYPAVLQRLRAIPGIDSAAIALGNPAGGDGEPDRVWPTAAPGSSGGVEAQSMAVSPDFFTSVGVRLRSGRDFTWSDNSRSRGVAVVSESLARQLGGHPLGLHLRVGAAPSKQDLEVVGIAQDAHIFDLRDTTLSTIYIAALQQPDASWKCFVLRGTTSIPQVNSALNGFGLELVTHMESLDDITDRVLLTNRLLAAVGTGIAGLALLLTAIGVFGVMAQIVTARRRELGIRLALGASRSRIARTVVGRGLATTAIGLGLGLIAAVWTTAALKAFVFGVNVHDAISFLVAPALLLLVALGATAVPAWRAADTDPLIAMRSE